MSFISFTFLVFFLLIFALYWLIRRRNIQNLLLLIASYVFYGWIHPWYAVMLGLSTVGDYFLSLGMKQFPSRQRMLVGLSLLLNLGVLAFFKYFNFFNGGLAAILNGFGLNGDPVLVNILLPAGLSFYTLKKLSYVLDVSRGVLEPTRDLVAFALYVSFFPQIVSGPIDRPQKLLPQFRETRKWKGDYFYSAWPLIIMGFFKKVVIADTMRIIVDRVFQLEEPTKLLLLSAGLGFTLQILADFSAYTDLSRGISLLLGFETSENFNRPYLSLSPTEFWNRWHITLSTWLRDYIFFPVRRALLKRRSKAAEFAAQVMPPLAAMSLSGLWHGAGWTFALWGLYYGVLIVIYHLAGIRGNWRPSNQIKIFLAWLIMFTLIVCGWLIFRAPSMGWLINILLHSPWTHGRDDMVVILITLSMTLFYATPLLLTLFLDRYPSQVFLRSAYYALLTLGIIMFISSASPDFIYFQF
jgi:alginate O-acetyltransferase complex protein AlgI